MYFYTVSRKNFGGGTGKVIGLYAAVTANGNAFSSVILYIVGKTLRRLVHGVNVHSVCTRADNAAEPAGAEFKLAVEAVGDLLLFPPYTFKLGFKIGVGRRVFKPEVIKLIDIHSKVLLFNFDMYFMRLNRLITVLLV